MRLRALTIAMAAAALASCGQQARAPRTDVAVPPAASAQVLPGSPAPESRGPVVTFSVWGRGRLPEGIASVARSLDGVVATATVGEGTVRLRPRSGPRRSVSVLAVDPAPLELSPSLAGVAASLRRGEAALNAAGAAFRGLRTGDRVRLEGDRALDVRVGALVRPGALFAREVVVAFDHGEDLGVATPVALIVATEPERFADVAEALVRAAGPGARIRPLEGDEREGTVMDPDEIRRIFGSFSYVRGPGDSIVPDPRWVRWAIVDWKVPILGRVRCHRNIIPQLYYALWEIEQKGLAHLIQSYEGCYVPRMQRLDDTALSAHAYGIALDFNAASNAQGDASPSMDPRIVEIMERWGFAWGGRFRVPDGMHFEVARIVRPPR